MSNSVTPGPGIKYQLLLEISQQISRTLDLQDVVDHLLSAVKAVVDYDAAGIFVLHRDVPFGIGPTANLIAAMASVGFPRIAEGNDPMLRSGKGIVGYVIRTGEPVIAADVSRDTRYIEGRPDTRSEIAVPIISNAAVIGALNLESDRLNAFSAADAELLEAFAVAAAISIEKAVLHRQVLEKHRIEQQLKIARDVQVSLLPASPPRMADYDIAGLNLPTWDIGGDYFDYLPLADGRLGVVIADVSGKGVPAALLMATFRAALRTEVRKDRPISAIVADVHQTLLESMDTSRFVTAVYGILDPRDATFTYLNCGHNPPLLLRADGRQEWLPTDRRAVGMFGAEVVGSSVVAFGPGDALLLYTDGVVEATNEHLAEFGQARLAQALSTHATQPADEIIGALVAATRAHAGREHYDDDFTLMVVKGRPAAVAGRPTAV